jgi:hypothetical protein
LPLHPVAISVTAKLPALGYVIAGLLLVEVEGLPPVKFHTEAMASVDRFVKPNTCPGQPCVPVEENEAVGTKLVTTFTDTEV